MCRAGAIVFFQFTCACCIFVTLLLLFFITFLHDRVVFIGSIGGDCFGLWNHTWHSRHDLLVDRDYEAGQRTRGVSSPRVPK